MKEEKEKSSAKKEKEKKEETKNAIIKNGTVIALALAIIVTMIGFAGGLSHYDTNIYKYIAVCGLFSSFILYVIKVMTEELGATNKIIKITCVIAVLVAGFFFVCYVAAHTCILIIWQ